MHLGNWKHARFKPRSNSVGLNRNIRNTVTVMVFESKQTAFGTKEIGQRCVWIELVVFFRCVHQHLSSVPA